MSDTHDHIANLRTAFAEIKKNGAEMIIHCGDFVSPFMIEELSCAGLPVHGVFGNNDGDRVKIMYNAARCGVPVVMHSDIARLKIDGCRIAVTHFRETAEDLAASGLYDLVCFGHTHRYYKDMTEECLLLNPGEMMGKKEETGFCIFDTSSRRAIHIPLPTPHVYDREKDISNIGQKSTDIPIPAPCSLT